MKTSLIKVSAVFASAFALAACDTEVVMDDGASEALAAAEARLAEMATYEAQLETIEAWREIWHSADVDRLETVAHSDYKRTAPDSTANSLDELKAFMLQVHAAYPDYKLTNDGMAAGPNGAFLQWTVTGSDSGRGEESTGNAIRVTGMSSYEFSDGKIASELVIFDTGSLLSQLESDDMPHVTE